MLLVPHIAVVLSRIARMLITAVSCCLVVGDIFVPGVASALCRFGDCGEEQGAYDDRKLHRYLAVSSRLNLDIVEENLIW